MEASGVASYNVFLANRQKIAWRKRANEAVPNSASRIRDDGAANISLITFRKPL